MVDAVVKAGAGTSRDIAAKGTYPRSSDPDISELVPLIVVTSRPQLHGHDPTEYMNSGTPQRPACTVLSASESSVLWYHADSVHPGRYIAALIELLGEDAPETLVRRYQNLQQIQHGRTNGPGDIMSWHLTSELGYGEKMDSPTKEKTPDTANTQYRNVFLKGKAGKHHLTV
ncbi:hypothetical protein ARMGADRAFT_1024574 [Armillaria gallica]|uniref:Uncharacterized protein n=1 Tax=Armillaria gallica TaxID=47427 RepID=A0A2H3DZN0_ARMGA|nr:hypothetical protein ARMGADRAFT_1024574 [Armillaria gallica]